jgi:ribonuclease HI
MGSGSTEDLSEKQKVVIHTDGACSGNPGPGGWGVILQSGQHRKELKGGEEHTTNNRMELMAAISALETLKAPSDIDLYTDSNYLRGGITSWIKGWKKNGWRTADKKSVRNIELWQRLEQAAERNEMGDWVKGHHGHDDNSAPTSSPARAWSCSCAPQARTTNPQLALPSPAEVARFGGEPGEAKS